MTSYVYETPNEKALSGALALVMHAVFFAMLVLSVNWQRQEAPAMMAELWSNLPSPKSDVPPPPPPPPPKVEPEPPKPAPRVEPKPEPKVEPKADIDLREKKEKERKAREQELAEKKKQQQEELAEKKKEQQKELAEKKKREEIAKADALKARQAKEAAEAKRKAQEQSDALKKLAQEQAAGQARELDKYKAAIAAHIKRRIIEPANLQGNPEVEFEVIQLPGGEILGVKTRTASGQAAWDNAVERAILKSQPLPQPPNPAMFKDVRELNLKFRPKE